MFFILYVRDSLLYITLVRRRTWIENEFYFPGNIKINWINEIFSIQSKGD